MGLDVREELPERDAGSQKNNDKRTYLSIYWKCCRTYSRVYKNTSRTAYEGQCPRCRGHLSVPIGQGGTERRTFIAE